MRITSAAIREVNPDITISAAVFAMDPERARHTVGQDWARWAHEGLVDALFPMSYVHDTRAFEHTVSAIIEAVAGSAPVYAGIGLRSGQGVMRHPEEPAAMLRYPGEEYPLRETSAAEARLRFVWEAAASSPAPCSKVRRASTANTAPTHRQPRTLVTEVGRYHDEIHASEDPSFAPGGPGGSVVHGATPGGSAGGRAG